jgi:hypothetical protein
LADIEIRDFYQVPCSDRANIEIANGLAELNDWKRNARGLSSIIVSLRSNCQNASRQIADALTIRVLSRRR